MKRDKATFQRLACLLCTIFLMNSTLLSAATTQPAYPVLIFDVQGEPPIPANFRTTQKAFSKGAENPPSRIGFDSLNASGSGQFTGTNFKKMLKDINFDNGYIIDLRKEFHGFLDNTPISWYGFRNLENKDRLPSTVASMEKKQLYTLGMQRKAVVYQRKVVQDRDEFIPRNVTLKEVRAEEELVNNTSNYGYLRLYILDHYPPDSSQIDVFVKFVKSLKDSTWLHFHCHAGEGRTTTFLVMYDMIRNAQQVSFEDILRRQHLIGGINLLQNEEEEWKLTMAEQRLALLKNFYNYVKDEEGYVKRSYSEWERYKTKAKKSRFSIFGF